MNPKILIIGSTGKLGTKLVNFCIKNNLKISAITCYRNLAKVKKQSLKLNCKYYKLDNLIDKNKFIKHISNTFYDLVYVLDYGYHSLKYVSLLCNNNSQSIFAIANKELLIAGGPLLRKLILNKNNQIIPLDSEHFSLYKSDLINEDINKVLITASGGPFYFDSKKNLNNVTFKEVINHPKWKMGINNSIDSSNFVNKILEIYELSSIYNIDLKKIHFLVSKNAYVHSLVFYKNNTISLNCFHNDMLISLIHPLRLFFNIPSNKINTIQLLDYNNFKFNHFNDKRFKLLKYLPILKRFNHHQQIEFMIANNLAHKLYLKQNLNYNSILDFIMKKIDHKSQKKNFKSIDDILHYINNLDYNIN